MAEKGWCSLFEGNRRVDSNIPYSVVSAILGNICKKSEFITP